MKYCLFPDMNEGELSNQEAARSPAAETAIAEALGEAVVSELAWLWLCGIVYVPGWT